MDNTALQILFELIQFDMQQIQNYREAIFEIAITIIAASFGISAFIYRKNSTLSSKSKSIILISTNIVLLLVLIWITYSYQYQGLRFSRSALELRQTALNERLFENKALTEKALYPDTDVIKGKDPEIKSLLERIPLYIAMCIVLLKAIVEGVILSKTRTGKPQQRNPADTVKQHGGSEG